jgi:hypothetical protein
MLTRSRLRFKGHLEQMRAALRREHAGIAAIEEQSEGGCSAMSSVETEGRTRP